MILFKMDDSSIISISNKKHGKVVQLLAGYLAIENPEMKSSEIIFRKINVLTNAEIYKWLNKW